MYNPATEPDFAKTVLKQQKIDTTHPVVMDEWLEYHTQRLDGIETQIMEVAMDVKELKSLMLNRISQTQHPTQEVKS